jgi:hypothetical protein
VDRLTAVLLLTASAGVVVAGYLAAYQVGAVDGVWDPLFGDASERVLRSNVASMLPVPDALLGMLAYCADLALTVLVAVGVGRRWARLALVLATGAGTLASVGLLLAQILLVHALCTLCVLSAALTWALAAGAILAAWRGRSQYPHSSKELPA